MLKIEIIEDSIRGEPGPSLYWSGHPEDFLNIAVSLHHLGKSNGESVRVNDLPNVQVQNGLSIFAHSHQGRKHLVKCESGKIIMALDCEFWRQIIHRLLSISFAPSFDYVEFDNREIVEEANFIIDSTGPTQIQMSLSS
jgi:hypothetical protein